MSGSPSQPAPVDLLALNDAQLREILEKSRQPDGSYELLVTNDCGLWSQEERDGLAQRLKTIQANSRPLDVDKLEALLQQVSNRDDDASSPTRRRRSESSESRETGLIPDERETYMQNETEAYDNLVKDGGRPLCPIGMLEPVSHDPEAHLEMLRPFWRTPHPDNLTNLDGFLQQEVFQRQQLRWRNFRRWQLDNRRMEEEGEDDEFLAHVEELKSACRKVGWGHYADEIEANPEILKRRGEVWYYRQRHCKWQQVWQREPECESFSDYEAALRARLTRHGFTRLFQLAEAEDPKQQDS
ncbi:hypothetical protein J3459_017604 [Metarhizium acridum]|nr:hypothetical protein J3459_017604 [Metarhizium acridum]